MTMNPAENRLSLASLFSLTTLAGVFLTVGMYAPELFCVLIVLFFPALVRTLAWLDGAKKVGRRVTLTEGLLIQLFATLACAWMIAAEVAAYTIVSRFVAESIHEELSPYAMFAGMSACIFCGGWLLSEAWWLPMSYAEVAGRLPKFRELLLIHAKAVAGFLFVFSVGYCTAERLLLELPLQRAGHAFSAPRTFIANAIFAASLATAYLVVRWGFPRVWLRCLAAGLIALWLAETLRPLSREGFQVVAAITLLIALPGVPWFQAPKKLHTDPKGG